MSDLLIRNIAPHLKRKIEESARERGESLSSTAQRLMERGLQDPESKGQLGTLLANLVPPEYRGDDLVFEYHGDPPVAPDFD
jgi:hypothetical protein